MKRIIAINPPVVCVNQCQMEWYSFAHPTSLLKIAAYFERSGSYVEFIDCMEYEKQWNHPLRFYKRMAVGGPDLNLKIDSYILGKSFEWLTQELSSRRTPDEIWISCHLTFNAELAHATISTISEVFPGIPIVFGGNYPTLFPQEAGKSGARVFRGRLPEALLCFPDYSFMNVVPDYMVFQLTLGCENDCSHCVNHMLGPLVKLDPEAVVMDIDCKRKKYGIRTFVNIDPNAAYCDLELFLQTLINRNVDVDLYFFGGIQPNLVTQRLVTLMKQANVKGLSLPRELGDHLNSKLKKKYRADDFFHAIRCFEEHNYDLSLFHCPFPVGLRDDNLEHIIGIIEEIKNLGAVAEIAPLSFLPGTLEFDRHADLLKEKNLEELNWALWPSLNSIERIRTYSSIYNMAHNYRFVNPWIV